MARRRRKRRYTGRRWIGRILGVRRRRICRRRRCKVVVRGRHAGALRRHYGIRKGRSIPIAWLLRDQHAPGKLGRRVRLALFLRGRRRR